MKKLFLLILSAILLVGCQEIKFKDGFYDDNYSFLMTGLPDELGIRYGGNQTVIRKVEGTRGTYANDAFSEVLFIEHKISSRHPPFIRLITVQSKKVGDDVYNYQLLGKGRLRNAKRVDIGSVTSEFGFYFEPLILQGRLSIADIHQSRANQPRRLSEETANKILETMAGRHLIYHSVDENGRFHPEAEEKIFSTHDQLSGVLLSKGSFYHQGVSLKTRQGEYRSGDETVFGKTVPFIETFDLADEKDIKLFSDGESIASLDFDSVETIGSKNMQVAITDWWHKEACNQPSMISQALSNGGAGFLSAMLTTATPKGWGCEFSPLGLVKFNIRFRQVTTEQCTKPSSSQWECSFSYRLDCEYTDFNSNFSSQIYCAPFRAVFARAVAALEVSGNEIKVRRVKFIN